VHHLDEEGENVGKKKKMRKVSVKYIHKQRGIDLR
jgi:hypothetical protein